MLKYTAAFLFSFVVGLTSLTATNPEYNGVGIVDLLLVGSAFLILAIRSKSNRITGRPAIILTLLILVLCSLLGRWLYFSDFTNSALHGCMSMPAIWPKVECALHLPFNLDPTPRQLLFHLTSLVVFYASFIVVREFRDNWSVCAIIMLIPAIFWSIYQILGAWGLLSNTAVGSNIIKPGYLPDGKVNSLITSNPGWLWPILLPGLGCSITLGFQKHKTYSRIGWIIATLCTYAILSSRQRGSYLALFVLAAICICYIVWLAFASCSKLTRSISTVFTFLFIAGVVQTFWSPILTFVGESLGFQLRTVNFLSFERLAIWNFGKDGILEHPWFGNGISSWMMSMQKTKATGQAVFETAHNFFIQLIFELGILHSVLVMTPFILLTDLLIRKYPRQRFCNFIMLGTIIPVLLVQEVDYINTIYYQFSIFFGIRLGSIVPPYKINDKRKDPKDVKIMGRIAFGFTAVTALALAFLLVRTYSLGGYGFEKDLSGKSLFSRWFRPVSQIVAYETREKQPASVFQISNRSNGFLGIRKGSKFIPVLEDALVLENGNPLSGRIYKIRSDINIIDPHRLLAFSVHMPPLQTSLIIMAQNGLSPYYRQIPSSPIAIRHCDRSCEFILKVRECRQGTPTLEFESYSPLVLREGREVEISISDIDNDLVSERQTDPQGLLASLIELPMEKRRFKADSSHTNINLGQSIAQYRMIRVHSNFRTTFYAVTCSPHPVS